MTFKKTTRPPLVDLDAHFPELAHLKRPALRLFPRPEPHMRVDESKLGGDFIWPDAEEWPVCSVHNVPFVTLIQVTRSEIPHLGFKAGTDIFQIIWCPHTHPECGYLPAHQICWRSASDIEAPRIHVPQPRLNEDFLDTDTGLYVPVQCRFHPDPIIEYPVIEELSPEMQERLVGWDVSAISGIQELQAGWRGVEAFSVGEWLYISELSVAGGTKIGGYPEWIQGPDYPACTCGRQMEHLMSISSLETAIGEAGNRWIPVEEKDLSYDEKYQIHYGTQLMFGDGGIAYVFICRHCDEWPIQLVWQCG